MQKDLPTHDGPEITINIRYLLGIPPAVFVR